jgi:pyruvate/2-oxoglutarate dehydrogenase complex dihydrolipoamide dehydrogenase (E3) component/uncharacterized membrane protein YdjX (TVP38/TMEM64 family)
MKQAFDVVVIGAGSGGLTAAVGLSKVGKSVLLVEREHLGGECTNSGCIPSKALLHHAAAYHEAVTITGATERSETYRQSAFAYVQGKIAETLADETKEHFERLGITVVIGEAYFTGKNSVFVSDISYTFKKAIIATGSAPRQIEIPGLSPEHILTNQNLFNLETVPARTLVIGGGPIGMEMGQALALLGSHVTIIENGDRFAKQEDEAISPIITKTFIDLGITIFTKAKVERVENGVATVTVTNHDETMATSHEVPFDKVLVAIGRVPNLPTGLDTAGVIATEFGITVDSAWRTSNKHIYALGDVAARLKFTHVADDTARQVITHLVTRGLISPTEKLVPKVTYTQPEIGQVGLSWNEAKGTFDEENIMRIEVPLSQNDRARTDSATAGVIVIIAKRLSGSIIGAHLIGPRAGELISTLTLAMENNISLYRLRSTIFAYPTYSLLLKRAGDYFLAKQITTLRTDLIKLALGQLPKILAAVAWLYGLLALYNYQEAYGLTATELALRIFDFITSTPWAPLLYILIYAIRPLTFFPGTALTILSGIFFGLWGIPYTMVGATLSAAVAYGAGHFFSESLSRVTRLIKPWTTPLHTHPFLTILSMRLTFFPFDMVAYGAGLLQVRFLPFLLATMLGTILGITTFVSIGASISLADFLEHGITTMAINAKFIFLSIVLFFASIAVSKFLKKKSQVK